MEPLQFDAPNISDPSRGTGLSFSGAGHFYLAGTKFISWVRALDSLDCLTGRTVLSGRDCGFSIALVPPAPGELRLTSSGHSPESRTKPGNAQEQGCNHIY